MKVNKENKGIPVSDIAVFATLIIVAISCVALTVYGVHCIINGSIPAVVWSAFTAGGAAMACDNIIKFLDRI